MSLIVRNLFGLFDVSDIQNHENAQETFSYSQLADWPLKIVFDYLDQDSQFNFMRISKVIAQRLLSIEAYTYDRSFIPRMRLKLTEINFPFYEDPYEEKIEVESDNEEEDMCRACQLGYYDSCSCH